MVKRPAWNVCEDTPDSNGIVLSPARWVVFVGSTKVAARRLNGIANAIARNTSSAAHCPSTAADYSTTTNGLAVRVANRMIWRFPARCRCQKLDRERDPRGGPPDCRPPPRRRPRRYHPGAPRTPPRVEFGSKLEGSRPRSPYT